MNKLRVRYTGDGLLPLVGTTVVRRDGYSIVRNMDKLKRAIDLGYEFVIKDGDKDVPAEEYFDKMEKVEAVSEITVEEEIEEETEEEFIQCQATTASGNRCSNEAKYPEEDPKYCGIHKSKLEE